MEARLAKVEAAVETFKEEFNRVWHEFDRVYKEFDRVHAEIADLRKELGTTTRWLVGLMIANMSLSIALFAKVASLH